MCCPTVSCTCQNLTCLRHPSDLFQILIGWLDRAFYCCHGGETAVYVLKRKKSYSVNLIND